MENNRLNECLKELEDLSKKYSEEFDNLNSLKLQEKIVQEAIQNSNENLKSLIQRFEELNSIIKEIRG